MNRHQLKTTRRNRRRSGIRKRVFGVPDCPRLSVYRSLRHIYAQLIDDLSGRTLASASSQDKDFSAEVGGNVGAAQAVGKTIAERATANGVNEIVFDRGGFRYQGRVKALAEAAREGGLKF